MAAIRARHKIRWIGKHCPVCGRRFHYIEGGYEPSTCSSFECLYKWLHDPKYKEARRAKQSR